MQTVSFHNYRLEHVFGQIAEERARELADFWTRHAAIATAEEARRRAQEACWIARDAANDIVAVCTLYTGDFGTPPRPHYFYRMFIRPADRKSGLAIEMVTRTRERLAANHRPDQPQQGLIIVSENPMLNHPGMREVFRKWGWSYQGQTGKGHDVWRLGNENMYPTPPAG